MAAGDGAVGDGSTKAGESASKAIPDERRLGV